MLRKKKIPSHRKYRQRIKPSKKRSGKYLDWALVSVSALVIILIGSTAIKFVQGETKTLPPEVSILRTQIANGCGIIGAAGSFSEWLGKQSDETLKFDIIDVSNYENSAIPNTMILIRDPIVMPKAELIASRIGIDPDNIILRELEDNFLSLDITIVLGQDYDKLGKHAVLLKADILNGCGVKGIARKFSLHLERIPNADVQFEIGNEDNYVTFDVDETLLIIKTKKAEKYSQAIAIALDIKKDNIIIDSPKNRTSDADVAIVIGKDWGHKLSTD